MTTSPTPSEGEAMLTLADRLAYEERMLNGDERDLIVAALRAAAQSSGVRDLPMFWQGRANALRILDSKRAQSDDATLREANVYAHCAQELRAAISPDTPREREK